MGSGSRGTRTHKRHAAAACFQDRSLIQPDGFRQCWLAVKFRGLESNQRPPRSERGVTTNRNCPGVFRVSWFGPNKFSPGSGRRIRTSTA